MVIRVDPKYRYLLKNTDDAYLYVNKIPSQHLPKPTKSDIEHFVDEEMTIYNSVISFQRINQIEALSVNLAGLSQELLMIKLIMNSPETIG